MVQVLGTPALCCIWYRPPKTTVRAQSSRGTRHMMSNTDLRQTPNLLVYIETIRCGACPKDLFRFT